MAAASNGYMLCILTVTLLLLPSVLSQAPGDRDGTCGTGDVNTNNRRWFPENWVLLLDSYDYVNLFSTAPATVAITPPTWEKRSFGTQSTGWEQVVAGTCQWHPTSQCTANTLVNNWLFSQYISYREAVEVTFNISYNFNRCNQRSTCNVPYITVYKYDTDGMIDDQQRVDTGNYQPISGDAQSSRLVQNPVNTRAVTSILHISRPTSRRGFYLGLQDTGTCGNVERVLAFYNIAPSRIDGPLRCPAVPLPVVRETSTVNCECLSHSSGIGSLSRTCDRDGVCNEGQMCGCDPGYEFNTTLIECSICPVDMYKAGVSNSAMCETCPSLSEARDPGSGICECIPPNSRGGGDGPETGCEDRRFSTGAAVTITFFVTAIVIGSLSFLAGALTTFYLLRRNST